MKLDMLLSNSAQISEGLLFVLGGGRSIFPSQPTQMAIAGKIEIPWDQTNMEHKMRIELLDKDGHPALPVVGKDADGFQFAPESERINLDMPFNVGRPPQVRPGTPLDHSFALQFQGLWLAPGGYTWQASIDGAIADGWYLSFTVIDPPRQ